MGIGDRIVVCTVALSGIVASPSGAFAQPKAADKEAAPHSAVPTDPVEARFEEGMTAIRAGDYEGALRAFAAAYAIRPMPRLLFDLALCEEKTGRWLDALKHYKAVIEEATTAEEDRADARRHVNTLEAKVGHLEVRAPASVGVAIDGGPIVATTPMPEPLAVPPGEHVVTVYLPAGVQSTSVVTPAGQDVHVDFRSPAAPVAAPPTATAGEAERPRHRAAVPAARIAVSVSLAAAGVAAVGTGIYLAEASLRDARDASAMREELSSTACHSPVPAANASRCASLQSTIDDQNRDARLSPVFYAVGGALAAGAIASWFLWPIFKPRAPSAWLAPSVDPRGFGIDVIGAF